MMQEAGLTELPPAVKNEYRVKLSEEAHKRLALEAMRKLSADQAQTLAELMEKDSNDFEAFMEYFRHNIPDFEKVMTDALVQFAKEFTETARKMA